jgi:hypothetical protein
MDIKKDVDRFTQIIKEGWRRRAVPIPARKKLLIIIVVGLLWYGTFIALDNLWLRPHLNDIFGEPIDLAYYQNRSQAILDGQIPYLDFESESPPLIMYLLVVPQFFGGEMWMYQLYFAIFGVLTALSLYLGFRRYDDFYAFTAGVAYLFIPFCFIEFTLGVQDEAVTSLFFLLPLITFIAGRMASTGLLFTLGTWTKLFDILLFPWTFLKAKTSKDKMVLLLIFAGLSFAVMLPFLICCPEQFFSFPSYYFLESPNAQTGGSGISPWHFLDLGGYGLPGWAGVTLTVASLLAATLLAYHWKMRFWEGATFIMVVFFIFYPKIAFVYFTMPVMLLLMWGVKDERVLWRLILMSIPLFAAVAFSENGDELILDVSWGWVVGLALSLVGWAIFVHTWWLTRGEPTFFEEDPNVP